MNKKLGLTVIAVATAVLLFFFVLASIGLSFRAPALDTTYLITIILNLYPSALLIGAALISGKMPLRFLAIFSVVSAVAFDIFLVSSTEILVNRAGQSSVCLYQSRSHSTLDSSRRLVINRPHETFGTPLFYKQEILDVDAAPKVSMLSENSLKVEYWQKSKRYEIVVE